MPSTPGTGTRPARARLCLLAAAVLVGGAAIPSAHADPMPACPTEGSTTVVEATVRDQHSRVATYSPSGTETDVCFQTMNSVQFVMAVHTEAGAAAPNIGLTAGDGACSYPVVRVGAPVELDLSTGVDGTAQSVCFGMNGATTTVTVTPVAAGPVPHVSLWLPANSALNEWGWCTTHWLKWKSGFRSAREAWIACYQQDNQVL